MDNIKLELKNTSGGTKSFISPEFKFLLKPLGILVIIIFIFVFSIKFILGQITTIREKIAESKKEETMLSTKLAILRNVTNTLPDDISFIDLALPSRGIAIYGISQIKSQAEALGLLVTDLKTGSPTADKDGISVVTITFDVEGNEQAIYEYLEKFSKLLPLMKVNKVELSKSEGIARAITSVSVYSGKMPEVIPSLTGPVKDLTNEEISILNDISTFSQPQFMISTVSSETPKEDPFN